MHFETVSDIYAANSRSREKLIETLKGVSAGEATRCPQGELWSIQQIAEHIAMVDEGTARICAKLLNEAKTKGKPSDGTLPISADFRDKSKEIAGLKVEAPERVQPTGEVPIDESLVRLASSRQLFDSIRRDLALFDLSDHKFAHPYFGGLTAIEWLIVAGGHESRHTRQIERWLDTIRQ